MCMLSELSSAWEAEGQRECSCWRVNTMLILTRRAGQKIYVGDQSIEITVVAVRGKQVRIGIKAPPKVPIRREELGPKPHPSEPRAPKAPEPQASPPAE